MNRQWRKQLRTSVIVLGATGGSMLFLVLLGWLGLIWWPARGVAVPEAAAVRTMTAHVQFVIDIWKEQTEFAVPAQHVPAILQALQPARKDYFPAKWVGWGRLDVTAQTGEKIRIDLYLTYERVGAFAVQAERRAYFRGGSDQGILDALRQAYLDSRVE
jgi:hypothetical protein